MEKKRIFLNAMMIFVFVILSIPMVSIEFVPILLLDARYRYSDLSTAEALYGRLVLVLAFISPMILLIMATIFRIKQLRVRMYVATVLFFWAALTQMFILYVRLLDLYLSRLWYWRLWWS